MTLAPLAGQGLRHIFTLGFHPKSIKLQEPLFKVPIVVKPPLVCADPPDLQPVPSDGGNGKSWSWYFVWFSFLLMLL